MFVEGIVGIRHIERIEVLVDGKQIAKNRLNIVKKAVEILKHNNLDIDWDSNDLMLAVVPKDLGFEKSLETNEQLRIEKMVIKAAELARTVVGRYAPPGVDETCFQEIFKNILDTMNFNNTLNVEKNES